MALISDVLLQILYVEPTVVGVVGAIVLHMLLWKKLSSWEHGLIFALKRRLETTSLFLEGITPNYEGDPLVEMFGFSEQPGLMFVWSVGTALHHGVGGGLMVLGWLLESPVLWKHGMLTEVGGLDVLDLFYNLPACLLSSQGPFPMSALVKTRAPYLYLQVFHHTVGLSCGLAVTVYFAHLPEFQWFGALILGGPVFVMVPQLLISCLPPTYYKLHGLEKCYSLAAFCYQRIVRYFPIAYSLCRSVHLSDTCPQWVKYTFYYSAFAMSIFNLVCCLAFFEGAYKVFLVKKAPPALARTQSGNTVAHITRAGVRHRLGFFAMTKVRSRSWANRARHAIHKKAQ